MEEQEKTSRAELAKLETSSEQITYLGSIVCKDGGAREDIQSRVSKARNIFRTMNNIWKSQQYSKHTKLRLIKAVSYLHYYMDQNA
jgi:hypothetical protein